MATIDLRGLPEVNQMLAQFEGKALNNRMRRSLRGAGAVFRKRMRAAGRMGWANRPRSFNRTRTRNHRNPLGVSVSPQSALSNIFEGGAGPHGIPITKGSFAGRTIRHPGVAARPFVGPIFEAGEDQARDAFGDELFEGIK